MFLVHMSKSESPRVNIFKDMPDNRAESRGGHSNLISNVAPTANVLIKIVIILPTFWISF